MTIVPSGTITALNRLLEAGERGTMLLLTEGHRSAAPQNIAGLLRHQENAQSANNAPVVNTGQVVNEAAISRTVWITVDPDHFEGCYVPQQRCFVLNSALTPQRLRWVQVRLWAEHRCRDAYPDLTAEQVIETAIAVANGAKTP